MRQRLVKDGGGYGIPVLLLTFTALFFILLPGRCISPTLAAESTATRLDCNVHDGPCTASTEGSTVTMEVTPRPVKAMTDLTFKVTFSGRQPAANPIIDLGMPGMQMGPNKVRLNPVGEGVYEGSGIIVRCPSGKRTWFARITVPGAETVEFVFEVIY